MSKVQIYPTNIKSAMENWKEIKGYEGYYEVSNLGNVRSVDRYINNNGGKQLLKGKPKAQIDNGIGYLQVKLYKNSKRKHHYVHVIVAHAFLGGDGEDVNHKDGNKYNNKSSNLEWRSKKGNHEHAVSMGLICRDKFGRFI